MYRKSPLVLRTPGIWSTVTARMPTNATLPEPGRLTIRWSTRIARNALGPSLLAHGTIQRVLVQATFTP
jgi:hypothetical protein